MEDKLTADQGGRGWYLPLLCMSFLFGSLASAHKTVPEHPFGLAPCSPSCLIRLPCVIESES